MQRRRDDRVFVPDADDASFEAPIPRRGREAEQVERSRRKTWSRARSEVSAPYRGCCRNSRDVAELSPPREENDREVILSSEEIPMAFNFLPCDRDQPYLLPPSLKDWLPEDHLAFFLLDAVQEMDLHSFYVGYREDGWGAPAFEPTMMVTLLLYAYCIGERSAEGSSAGARRTSPSG
jgi:hypothetical protein